MSRPNCGAYAGEVAQRPGNQAGKPGIDPATDDGSPDQRIRTARTPVELLAALRAGRLLVAIVATAEEVDESGADKSSHMSVVSMVAADGRRGLLAFTGLDSLQAWDQDARPVPVSGPDAAQAALDDGCEALVVDVAGPRRTVVVEADLLDLAGKDRIAHAAMLVREMLEAEVASGATTVEATSDRLRIACDSVSAEDIASIVQGSNATARVLALVPSGIEIQASG